MSKMFEVYGGLGCEVYKICLTLITNTNFPVNLLQQKISLANRTSKIAFMLDFFKRHQFTA